jgi:peptidoglycan/xylan/chitin deacetylase (PgdA/CDA1 family)
MARKNLLILFLLIFVIIFLIFSFNIKSLAISKSKDNDDFSFSILCYHNIKATPSNDYDVSLIDFDRQMHYLSENGFTPLFASEVVDLLKEYSDKNFANKNISQNENNNLPSFNKNGNSENKKFIAITFDDGNDGVYIYADKILSKYGLKATLYIYPSIIFAKERNNVRHYMTFKQINKLIKTGRYELGCHSYYHPYMTKEDEKGLFLNTQTAKATLLENTQIEPKTFAYPFGFYNDKVIEYVKKAGFIGAFTVDRKFVTTNTDLYKIPRFIITKDISFEKFVKIVNAK